MRKSLIVRMTIVIVFLGLGLVTNAQAQSDAGLVAEWHFDEGSGTILKDSSGNGNDGTIYGATWTTGISGKALSFDGKDDYINCGSINLDSSAFTYEVWFKTLESTDELLMVKEPATGDTRGYFISMGEGGPMGFGNGWGYIRTTKTYNDGKWHHVVGVFDDSLGTGFNKLKIYVDGITPSTTTVGSYSSPYIAPSSFYIGIYGTRTDTNDLFDGDIDEVRIYNRALSAGEIKAHYDTLIGSASVAPIAPTIAPSTSVTTPTSSPLSAPTPQPEKEEDGPSVSPVFLIGAAILAIVLIAGIGLSRRGKSGSGDATKPQPPVEPPTPPAEPPKPKAEVKPPEPPKAQRPIEPEPKVEATKPEPVRETAPLKPESAITITSAVGYKGPTIFHKIKVENPTSEPVSDVKIRLFVPDTFLLKEPEKSIALLKPNESKTVTFEIRPTKECGDCEVSGRVTYYDYASRKTRDADIPAKLLSIVCPVLRPWEIEEPEWRSAISRLVKAEETTREIEMPAKILFETVTDIFKDLNLFMLPATVTETPQLYRAIARFAAEGVKGLKYAVQIEVVGGAKKSKLFLKAWAEKEEALTGFYHGILSDIKERVQVENLIDIGNVYVNIDTGGGDYMSGGTKTETGGGDYLEGGAKKVEAGGDYQEGGAIKTAEIGVLRGGISSTKKQESKCPRCGRAISEDEKFCPACGAKVE